MNRERIQPLESTSALPVDCMFGAATERLIALHHEISALGPSANPADRLAPLDAMLTDLGVTTQSNDLLLGVLGHMATSSLAGAFGVAAQSPAMMAIDFGMNVASGYAEQKNAEQKKTGIKRANTNSFATSVFSRAKTPAAAPVAPQRKMAATAMLRAAGRTATAQPRPQVKFADLKRRQLMTEMAQCQADMRQLSVFRREGTKYARRMTVQDQRTGAPVSLLVRAGDTPRMAYDPKARKHVAISAPRPGMAA